MRSREDEKEGRYRERRKMEEVELQGEKVDPKKKKVIIQGEIIQGNNKSYTVNLACILIYSPI